MNKLTSKVKDEINHKMLNNPDILPPKEQTNGQTGHVDEHLETAPEPGRFAEELGPDSSVYRTEGETRGERGDEKATGEVGGKVEETAVSVRKYGKNQLIELDTRLSDRDRAVLTAISKYRFLLTGHVQRLYFNTGVSVTANTRATNRALKKLREYGLIAPLKRRIGGVRAGSASLIWHLTEPGNRLLNLSQAENKKRKRFKEPSPMFLEHTLAIAETAVQIETICGPSEDLEVVTIDTEPTCWRSFYLNNQRIQLKPDAYLVTSYDDYEDSWFLELDLGTESTSQVIEKCRTYFSYYRTGLEQKEHDVFPVVVWIVPDENRKRNLKQAISNSLPEHPKFFLVITPVELEKMLRQYIERQELC